VEDILIFEWLSLLEIETNCKKKIGFGRKKIISSALNVFTLGPTAQTTLIFIKFGLGR